MWDTIHDDFVQFFLASFNYMEFLYDIFNKGMIKIIPRKVFRDSIGGRKSIYFIMVTHKFMAKPFSSCVLSLERI